MASAEEIALWASMFAGGGRINGDKFLQKHDVDYYTAAAYNETQDFLFPYSGIRFTNMGFEMNTAFNKFSDDTSSFGMNGAEGSTFFVSNNHPNMPADTSFTYSHASAIQIGGSDCSGRAPHSEKIRAAFEKDITSYIWNFKA